MLINLKIKKEGIYKNENGIEKWQKLYRLVI